MFLHRQIFGSVKNESRLGWVFVCLLLTTFSFTSRLNARSLDDQMQSGVSSVVAAINPESVVQRISYPDKTQPNHLADCGWMGLSIGCLGMLGWQIKSAMAGSGHLCRLSLLDLGIRLQI